MRFDAAILVGAGALLAPLAAGASPLVNSGFETGTLAPWFQGIGTLDTPLDEFWSSTSTTAATGSWSAQNVGNNELRQNFAPIATSSILEVSFFLRKEGIIGLQTAVQFRYDDGSFTQAVLSASGFGVWEQHDITGELEAGKQLAGISFFGVRTDVGTRTYVDDVRILVPEPGTACLLGLGLSLLARRRRPAVSTPSDRSARVLTSYERVRDPWKTPSVALLKSTSRTRPSRPASVPRRQPSRRATLSELFAGGIRRTFVLGLVRRRGVGLRLPPRLGGRAQLAATR